MTEPNVPQVNPLLQKLKLPGRIFQLPSRGLFYTNSELDPSVVDGEVHIHAMSAFDEINMKNPDMLFSGKAFEEVCKTCIPSILKPNEMLARDVDAIMIFLRVITYGNNYDIDYTHICEDAKKHTYSINIDDLIGKIVFIDPTTIESQCKITLSTGQLVTLQPAKYSHVVNLMQKNANKTEFTADDIKQTVIDSLLSLIKDVDGVTDKKFITEWVKTIPSPVTNSIAKKIDELNNWGPMLKHTLTCGDCKALVDVEVPLNPINFFSE